MGCQVLYHSVALFLCLMMIVHIRAQCTRPIFEGNVVLSEKFLQTNSFQDGDQVTFECETGYKPTDLKASKTVNCVGNKWTPLQLECERKSCGSPPDFPNGKYEILKGILFGDTITGVCNKGYENLRYGSAERTCRTQGWDGGPPQCEAIKCILPPHIQNGYIEGWHDEDKEYEYGYGVTYKCDPKFSLVGDATLICSENRSFQPEPPKCVDASCPSPTVTNGVRTGGKSPPYSAGHFLDYKCKDGYDMKGSDHIVCTVRGWDPEPPQCIGYCVLPVFEGHVTVANSSNTNKFPIGSKLEFKCESGCRPVDLKASNFVTCDENAKWTPLELKCEDENVPESGGRLMTILLSVGGVLAFLIAVAVGFFVKKKVSKRDSFHKVTRNEEREL